MENKLKHFKCKNCGKTMATDIPGHIPICKKCGKIEMEEIKDV